MLNTYAHGKRYTIATKDVKTAHSIVVWLTIKWSHQRHHTLNTHKHTSQTLVLPWFSPSINLFDHPILPFILSLSLLIKKYQMIGRHLSLPNNDVVTVALIAVIINITQNNSKHITIINWSLNVIFCVVRWSYWVYKSSILILHNVYLRALF